MKRITASAPATRSIRSIRLIRGFLFLLVAAVVLTESSTNSAAESRDIPPQDASTGDIRVCLTDEPLESSVVLKAESNVSLDSLGKKEIRLAQYPARTELRVDRRNGVWIVNGKRFDSPTLEFVPHPSPGLWVNNRLYRGVIRLQQIDAKRFWAINLLPLESYLCSVVDGEIPGTFENEARKAQAVAARTYALRRRQQNADKEYDVWASPARDQNYHGFQYKDATGRAFAGESPKSRQAVRETQGLVLERDGRLARTYYSACCGGLTSAGTTTFPDATDMPSVVCQHCQDCPKFRWTATLTRSELTAALRKAAGKSAPKSFEIATAEVPGADVRTKLPDLIAKDKTGKTLTVDTRSFRSALPRTDLHSVWFRLTPAGEVWRADGIGHGHGVGLCQWGANGFAKDGKTFKEILKHYYPGTDVKDYQP